MTTETFEIFAFTERLLKVSLPSMCIWLLGFYLTFHLELNILSEIFQFGDRNFYEDWWNSKTLGEYWRLWNRPVHLYLKRHIYIPLKAKNVLPMVSMIVVFFLSAVEHEYLIGGACHILTYWSFLGMFSQVPIVIAMEMVKKKLESS